MKSTSILVNTARGPIVDEVALVEALQSGGIAQAALDVFEQEPLSPDSPLRGLSSVVLTDHCGYYSEEALIDLKTKAARNVLQVLKGEPPVYAVNRVENG